MSASAFFPDSIDYAWAPRSYHDRPDPLAELVHRVQPQRRRDLIAAWLDQRPDAEMPDWLTMADVQHDDRKMISEDLRFLSGQFLPPLGRHEVELARIVTRHLVCPIISLRAVRPLRGWGIGWRYRLVDEFPSGSLPWELPIRWSQLPLTLKQVVHLLDAAMVPLDDWSLTPVWGLLAEGFTLRVESVIYRELEAHYNRNITAAYPEDDVTEEQDQAA
jgi:hypothetical protein